MLPDLHKVFFQHGAQVDRALAKAEKAVREEAFAPPPRDGGAEATGILRFNGWRCNASNQTVATVATVATKWLWQFTRFYKSTTV